MYVKNDGKIGINTSSVKGTEGIVHIANAINTDTNWFGHAPLVVENNGICAINIRTTNNSFGELIFSDPDAQFSGAVVYNHSLNELGLYASATGIININSTGIYIGGIGTPSNPLHVQSTTTPQVRIGYDADSYWTASVANAGDMTLAAGEATGRLTVNPGASDPVLYVQSTGATASIRVGSSDDGEGINISHDGTNGLIGTLGATPGNIVITNTTECTGANTGALQVDGGVHVAKDMEITGDLRVSWGGSGTPVAGWLSDGTPYYKKIINIGDWNMDATETVNIAHGLSITKILSVSSFIINDAGTIIYNLLTAFSSSIQGAHAIGASNVTLSRINGGAFDNANYDSTSYNRGRIEIDYIS
jgi:hypothetical protein